MTASLSSDPPCLPEVIECIQRRFNPLRTILFGSWARGDARKDSDMDLLVVLPHVDNKRHAAVEILLALNRLPIGKDVVVTTPEEIAVRGKIVGDVLHPTLGEGKVVYERR